MRLAGVWVALLALGAPVCLASIHSYAGSSLRRSMEARASKVWTPALREAQFAAVPHISGRPSCEVSDPPEALATPDPLVDIANPETRVTVSFIIGTDGRVHAPLILESAGTLEDRSVLDAVSLWRYRPAKCNGVPTEAEGKIEFSSR